VLGLEKSSIMRKAAVVAALSLILFHTASTTKAAGINSSGLLSLPSNVGNGKQIERLAIT